MLIQIVINMQLRLFFIERQAREDKQERNVEACAA
jgi:hypothetical protein